MAMTVGELNVEIGAKLNKLDRGLNEMDRKLANSKKSVTNLAKSFSRLAAAAGIAFGVREITAFIKESAVLAGQMEGVRQAYERVADPSLMNRLKEATRGTVSELQLMQSVTTSANFGIALEQLPTLLEFARRRAKDMGVEVDVLTEKIVRGIGRKSVLILDDLGISASQIKEQLGGVAVESASVADITKAIGSIARESYADFEEGALTTGEQLAITQAELLNAKVAFGEWLTPATSAWTKFQAEVLRGIPILIENFSNFFNIFDAIPLTEENFKKLEDAMGRALTKTEKATILGNGFNETQKALIRGLIEYKQEQDNANESTEEATNLTEDQIKAAEDYAKALQNLNQDIRENHIRIQEMADALIESDLSGIGSILNYFGKDGKLSFKDTVGIGYEDVELIQLLNSNLDAFGRNVDEINEKTQVLNNLFGTQLANAFASAVVSMGNFGQIMIDALKRILQQLIAVVAQAAILAVIMNIIAPGSGSFNKIFKGLLGFGGERASGGPVNFGQAYLVGERGPELFMPGRSGSIMPNNKLGMMGATVAVGGRLLGQDILISNARSQQGLSRQTGR